MVFFGLGFCNLQFYPRFLSKIMNNSASNLNNQNKSIKLNNDESIMDTGKFNSKAVQFVRKSIDSDDFTLPDEANWPSFLQDKLKKTNVPKKCNIII